MAEQTTNQSGATASVGERLRRAREAKGFSLEQVSRVTKIHVNVLTAIEADRAAQTISPIYLKGFLKTYARHVGEDETALLASVPAPQNAPVRPTVTPPTPRARAAATRPAAAEAMQRVTDVLARVPWRSVGAAVGVVLLLWFGVRFIRTHRPHPAPALVRAAPTPTTPDKTTGKTSTKKTKTASAVTKTAKKKSPASKIAAAVDGVRLTVHVQSMTWVQVMADGAVIFQQVLQPGAQETWLAKHEVTLWLGDAGAVSLELNGRPLGVPGKHGEVLRGLRITPQGMQR